MIMPNASAYFGSTRVRTPSDCTDRGQIETQRNNRAKQLMFNVKLPAIGLSSVPNNASLQGVIFLLEMVSMARNKFARRPVFDDRLDVVCTATLKQRAYEVAAAKGITAAQLVRQAVERELSLVAA